MFNQCQDGRRFGNSVFPQDFLDQAEVVTVRMYSSVVPHATRIARDASISAELYVHVTVTLNICCCDSVNDYHKNVAVSGILSVCDA